MADQTFGDPRPALVRRLQPYAETARAHPDGVVDLSTGTPVDPTPEVVQRALGDGADSPGHPVAAGLPATRQAAIDWLARCHGVEGLGRDCVLPTIGAQELVTALPLHLGLGEGDLVVHPQLADPAYAVSAALAGARARGSDSLTALGPEVPRLLWLNSPSDPTGRVLPVEHLRKVVAWCRERGTILVSDERCLDYSWAGEPPLSVLHPTVSGGAPDGILAVHSLSLRSNMAGYRCAFVAGDPRLVGELLRVRTSLGLALPGPQQVAMAAALDDDAHLREQHARYAARRAKLREALQTAGFAIDHSEASVHLWASRGEDCWQTVGWLAERGILVTPGELYGPLGRSHVRVAFTATDERIDAAVGRLTASRSQTG